MCEILYSNKAYGIKARSMTIEDLNEAVGFNPNDPEQNEFYNTGYKYYPSTYSEEDLGTKEEKDGVIYTITKSGVESSKFYTSPENLVFGGIEGEDEKGEYLTPTDNNPVYVKTTYYHYNPSALNPKVSEILGEETGWLASPVTITAPEYTHFGMSFAYDIDVSANGLVGSYDNVFEYDYGLRPVVTIEATIIDAENSEISLDENKPSTWELIPDNHEHTLSEDETECEICGLKSIPQALYSSLDNSLRFVRNFSLYEAGDTYDNNEITNVYTGFETAEYTYDKDTTTANTPWWSVKDSITSVNFENKIYPINTANWFCQLNNCSSFDVNNLITDNVTNMIRMFDRAGYNATTFTITGLDNWNTSNVMNMRYMFNQVGRGATTEWTIGNLDNWDTSKVTDMRAMFYQAGRSAITDWIIGDLNNWNTSNVTDMGWMFYSAGENASTWNIGDVSKWNTSKVTRMYSMFCNVGQNTEIFDIGNLNTKIINEDQENEYIAWDTSKVTQMCYMFNDSGKNAAIWNIGELTNWDTSNVTDMSEMFSGAGARADTINIGDLSNWNTSNVTNLENMFSCAFENTSTFDIGNLSTKTVILEGKEPYTAWDVSNVTDISGMFYQIARTENAKEIDININMSNWDTSNVTDMSEMFAWSCSYVKSFKLIGLDDWDTSKVTNMKNMFAHTGMFNATEWNVGDLSNWDTSNVTDMSNMFSCAGFVKATAFNIGNLCNWNTSKVTSMHNMFAQSGRNGETWYIGELDKWNTSNVIDMSGMFDFAGSDAKEWCIGDISTKAIETIDGSYTAWDTANVTNMQAMFKGAGCNATTFGVGDISNWNTSNVTDMGYMFVYAGNCSATFYLELTNWNVNKVTEYTDFNLHETHKIIPPNWVN